MRTYRHLCALALLGFTLVPGLASSGGIGRKLPTRSLVAQVRSATVRMDCGFDPVLFELSSFRNRYKVLRIDIANRGQKPFVLSPTDDRLEAVSSGRTVPAILSLSASDPAAWDSLSEEMRRALVYPATVEPGEQEAVFIFLKNLPPHGAVTELHYRVASVPEPIVLQAQAAMAK